jgi:alkanesulfonate monooxygenase SsuD/methylene tetrahydromethanopterin reductase-like flavin-dependent oxidoreductase (luciferase family)
MAITLLHRGQLTPVPTVETAERWLAGEGLREAMPPGRRLVFGSPATVRAGLEQVAADYHADEVVIVTTVHDHDARRRSYELTADAFGLASSPRTAAQAATSASMSAE